MRITVAYLRDLEQQVTKGEISYSRMVELINERALHQPNEEAATIALSHASNRGIQLLDEVAELSESVAMWRGKAVEQKTQLLQAQTQLSEATEKLDYWEKANDRLQCAKDELQESYDKMALAYANAAFELQSGGELEKLKDILKNVEIMMEQNNFNNEYDGVWRDDEDVILEKIKQVLHK